MAIPSSPDMNQANSRAAAKNQAASNPEKTVYDVKRLIGRKFEEKDVQNEYGPRPSPSQHMLTVRAA